MTFEECWQQLVSKDTRIFNNDSKIEMTSKNLQALLRQFYAKGKMSASKPQADKESDNFFKRMFR